MNTRILEHEFEYISPKTLDEALLVLSDKKYKCIKPLAGGTDVMVKLKMDAYPDIDCIMDIGGLPELGRIERTDDGGIAIGAAVKLSTLEHLRYITECYGALHTAIHAMASVSVRNMATLGGNVCNASPVADCAGPLICYGAKLLLKSANNTRTMPVEDFFLAPGVTALKSDELLTHILLPKPGADMGAAFIKVGRVKSDIAKLSVSVVLKREKDTINTCRISMGSVAATPLFLRDISHGLSNKPFDNRLVADTAIEVANFIKPIDDNRTTAQYRKDMSNTLISEALFAAWQDSLAQGRGNTKTEAKKKI